MRTGVALLAAGVIVASVVACGSTTATLSSQDTTVAAAGIATKAAGSAQFTLTVSARGKSVSAIGDVDFRTQTLQLNRTGGDSGQEVLAHGILYVQAPGIVNELPAGKVWISENLETFSKAADGVALDDFTSNNPLGGLNELGSSSGTTKKGTAVVDGVTCTRYAGTIALSKAAAAQTNPVTRAALLTLATHFHGTIGLQVWVGPGGLIYRLAESLPSVTFGSITTPAFSEQLTFSHFGEKVAITPPAPDYVQDETQAAIADLMDGGA